MDESVVEGTAESIEIFSAELQNGRIFNITFNWVAFVAILVIGIGIYFVIQWIIGKVFSSSVEIADATVTIGSASVTLKRDGIVREIAYKIMIELKTRKIGLEFEERKDVISEVYDSWYSAFGTIRGIIEEIPANRLDDARQLVDVTMNVLNIGLRPHLTKWPAKYRAWYKNELEDENNKGKAPQEIQKIYCEYATLISEMRDTTAIMQIYISELEKIAYKKK